MRRQLTKAIAPGSYLPTAQFPVLKCVPGFLLKSRTRAKHAYDTFINVSHNARERVETRRATGSKRECLVDKVLDEEIKCDVPLTYKSLNTFFTALHEAAADTTATAILHHIVLLVKHPRVQEKARLAVDQLCGVERIPKWADFKDLPYINCIVKEGLRFRPG